MKNLLSKVFELGAKARAGLYRKGWIQAAQLRCPVISVGNLTVGGTGKTPFVAFLAGLLKEAGYRPAIVSRGYRSKAENSTLLVTDGRRCLCGPDDCGDEPYWYASRLHDVPVVVGKDRSRGGELIEQRYGDVIHILDDGFQHLKLHRDLDILLIDATNPFGNGKLLPGGVLREPLNAISRAGQVVVTRSHYGVNHEELELEIRKRNPLVPVYYFHHDAVALWDLKTRGTRQVRDFVGKPVAALAGIGNPQVFLRDLGHYQMRVVDQIIYRDHHRFSQGELNAAVGRARKAGAKVLVTTEKDAVRLQELDFDEGNIFAVQIEVRAEDLDAYRKALLEEVADLIERCKRKQPGSESP
jgi:tetraacyldisaccharide 4'-kinase